MVKDSIKSQIKLLRKENNNIREERRELLRMYRRNFNEIERLKKSLGERK